MPPTSDEVDLTIVLPAYREAESLETLLPQLRRVADSLQVTTAILIVDSEQPLDDTAAICSELGVQHIHRTGGNSFGDAVRSGIASAKGRHLLFMDADGSHNPDLVRLLWDNRDKGDIIVGSRYVAGGGTENPKILIFLSWLVNVVFRLFLGLKCRDVSNSLRLYQAEHLKSTKLVSDNFDIVEEILIKLLFGPVNRVAYEVPIVFERRKAGSSKRSLVRFAFSYFGTLVRLTRFKWQIRKARGAA